MTFRKPLADFTTEQLHDELRTRGRSALVRYAHPCGREHEQAAHYVRHGNLPEAAVRLARAYPDLDQLPRLVERAMNDPDRTQAAIDVLAERRRHVEVKGWHPAHDDEHERGEISRAALNYLAAASITMAFGGESYATDTPPPFSGTGRPLNWPWERRFWKPGTARRMLVKVGALVLAEIERIDRGRAAPIQPSPPRQPSGPTYQHQPNRRRAPPPPRPRRLVVPWEATLRTPLPNRSPRTADMADMVERISEFA